MVHRWSTRGRKGSFFVVIRRTKNPLEDFVIINKTKNFKNLEKAPESAHNPKVRGSNPLPATILHLKKDCSQTNITKTLKTPTGPIFDLGLSSVTLSHSRSLVLAAAKATSWLPRFLLAAKVPSRAGACFEPTLFGLHRRVAVVCRRHEMLPQTKQNDELLLGCQNLVGFQAVLAREAAVSQPY